MDAAKSSQQLESASASNVADVEVSTSLRAWAFGLAGCAFLLGVCEVLLFQSKQGRQTLFSFLLFFLPYLVAAISFLISKASAVCCWVLVVVLVIISGFGLLLYVYAPFGGISGMAAMFIWCWQSVVTACGFVFAVAYILVARLKEKSEKTARNGSVKDHSSTG